MRKQSSNSRIFAFIKEKLFFLILAQKNERAITFLKYYPIMLKFDIYIDSMIADIFHPLLSIHFSKEKKIFRQKLNC